MSGRSPATTIVVAARIHTFERPPITHDAGDAGAGREPAPKTALLVRDGRIAAVDSPDALQAMEPGAEILDLSGHVVTPGMTDAHVHLVEWALARSGVDLTSATSPADAATRVADSIGAGLRPAPRHQWVRGRGWSAGEWTEPPHRDVLDRRVGDRPVVLQSNDMHSIWVNSAALDAAGIDAGTADPEGGRIERGPDGRLSGILRENAVGLLLRAAPAPTFDERRGHLLEGQEILHRLGVTGVHTVEPDSLGLLESVRSEDRLRLRVLQHLGLAYVDDAIRLGLRSGFGGEWIRIGGVKMFLDGALGSRTAWLREPYETSDDRGVSTLPPATFRDVVARGSAAGLAMTVHAIGDAAVDLALDVLGGTEAARLAGPVPHRIEHVQLVGSDRLRDAGAAGIVCSVQPQHIMTDWRAVDREWGGRGRSAYAFRSLRDGGAVLALGSDAPVVAPDPRLGLYAAVVRRDPDGEPEAGWYPEESLSTLEAFEGYTVGAAHAAGDRRQGRLAPGSFADLVAWDRDPLTVEPAALPEIRCVMTMVGGDVVWRDG